MSKRLTIASAALLLVIATAGSFGWLWLNDFDLKRALHFAHDEEAGQEPKTKNVEDHTASVKRSESARRHLKNLYAAQDRATQGDRGALLEQKRLLAEIARDISQWPDGDLGATPNIVVMLAYVLCGGNAIVIEHQLEGAASSQESSELKDVIAGVRAYGARRRKEALERFSSVDWQIVDVSLVGPFALAKASLSMKDLPKDAVLLLDRARLSAPFSAIDEAATRWEVPLLIADGQFERGLQLASQYLRKFSRSIYAERFLESFAASVSESKAESASELFETFTTTIESVDDGVRAELFSDVSKRALSKGNINLAKVAADAVKTLNSTSMARKRQAELYSAAADAPTENASAAVKRLNDIDGSRLDAGDKEILATAKAIAVSIVGVEAAARQSSLSGTDLVAQNGDASASPTKNEGVDRTISRVEKVLAETDRLISGE